MKYNDMIEGEGLLQYVERTTNKVYKTEIDWDEVDRAIKFIEKQDPVVILPFKLKDKDILKILQ